MPGLSCQVDLAVETAAILRIGRHARSDMLVFDGERRVVYRGQLDDSPRNDLPVTAADVWAAVDAVLAGRPVDPDHALPCDSTCATTSQTPYFGQQPLLAAASRPAGIMPPVWGVSQPRTETAPPSRRNDSTALSSITLGRLWFRNREVWDRVHRPLCRVLRQAATTRGGGPILGVLDLNHFVVVVSGADQDANAAGRDRRLSDGIWSSRLLVRSAPKPPYDPAHGR